MQTVQIVDRLREAFVDYQSLVDRLMVVHPTYEALYRVKQDGVLALMERVSDDSRKKLRLLADEMLQRHERVQRAFRLWSDLPQLDTGASDLLLLGALENRLNALIGLLNACSDNLAWIARNHSAFFGAPIAAVPESRQLMSLVGCTEPIPSRRY